MRARELLTLARRGFAAAARVPRIAFPQRLSKDGSRISSQPRGA